MHKALDLTKILLEIYFDQTFHRFMLPFGVNFTEAVSMWCERKHMFLLFVPFKCILLSGPPGSDFHSQTAKTEQSAGDNMNGTDENKSNLCTVPHLVETINKF